MKKKLFKELTKSIKQAGKIKRKRDSNKTCGYYVSWSEKVVSPTFLPDPKFHVEWEQKISGPHSEFVAKQTVEYLRDRGENYAKNILGLHYDALSWVNHN